MRDNISKFYQAFGFSKWLGKSNGSGDTECVDLSNLSNIEPTFPPNTDPMYISWLEEHPNALSVLKKILIDDAKGKQIVVFLDYDGTLSPIVDDPNRAFMSDEMRAAVSDVAKHFPTAIISGRLREKVHDFVKLDEVYYAGSHGMDIVGPPLQSNGYDSHNGNESCLFQPAKEFLPALQKIMEELKTRTRGITGVFIEDNRYCLSVHYRHVRSIDYVEVEKIVVSITEEFETFKVTKGIKVLEIRPNIDWNKGNALVYLLQTLGFTNYDNVLPIYIGDDLTDEDAFKALKNIGHGCPIIVSSVEKETLASFSLRDPSQVKLLLDQLAKWGELTKLIN